ncbi:MAG TPA: hypothetical protein VIN62_02095, partial [Candidatus Cryosericum sp.]
LPARGVQDGAYSAENPSRPSGGRNCDWQMWGLRDGGELAGPECPVHVEVSGVSGGDVHTEVGEGGFVVGAFRQFMPIHNIIDLLQHSEDAWAVEEEEVEINGEDLSVTGKPYDSETETGPCRDVHDLRDPVVPELVKTLRGIIIVESAPIDDLDGVRGGFNRALDSVIR